jgi:hypothetical protein
MNRALVLVSVAGLMSAVSVWCWRNAFVLGLSAPAVLWFVMALINASVAVKGIAQLASRSMHFIQALAVVIGGMLAGGAVAAIAMIPVVASETRTVITGAPACLQVASGSDYRPAQSVLDLSGLSMLASHWGGIAPQFHAVLVVDAGENQRLFNWSYRRFDWVPYVSGPTPVVRCRTRPDPIGQLAWLPSAMVAEDQTIHFGLGGHTFEIPATYQPWASAANGRRLTILARAPEFTPLDDAADRAIPKRFWREITVQLDPESMKHALTTQRADISEGNYESGDRAVTRIYCWPPSFNAGLSCEHVFLRDGSVYRFHHGKSDLVDWRAMQDRVVSLVHSFQLAKSD